LGGLTLASGDSFLVKQEAGNGNTWSYTATTDLVITSYSIQSLQMYLGTWVLATSGIYRFLDQNGSANPLNKLVLKSGETLTANGTNIDNYGVFIGGFEL